MLRNRLFALLGLLVIASMVLAACGAPAAEEAPAATEEGAPAATEEAAPAEPKVMVACLAQEPSTLFEYGETALVTSFVLDALKEPGGVDARTYDYQPNWYTELAYFDTGRSVKNTVEVGVGDVVYNPATDESVPLEVGTTISLNQAEGDPIEVTVEEGQKYPTIQIVSTWTMVDGMTWEDGTPVTTADILFGWEIGSSPDTPNSKYVYTVLTQKVEAVDDSTYTYHFMPGYTSGTYFVDGALTPFPKHVYGEGGSRPLTPAEMLNDEEINRDPLAFGPFKLTEWVAGDHITLEKNETYWRAGEGLPKVDTLIYRFIPDTNQLIAQLASGECDFGTQDAAFEGSLPLIRQFEAEGLMVPQVVAGTVFEHIDFNMLPVDSYKGASATLLASDGERLFTKAEFRQAVAYCLDRQAVVDGATNGAAIVQHTYTSADHPLYAGDENITIYDFNPDKGKELLAGLGWSDTDGDAIMDDGKGNQLAFIHSVRINPLREKVTQIIQAQLKDNCGIVTTIEPYGSEYFSPGPEGIMRGRQYDLAEFAWLTGVQPPCDLYMTTQITGEEFGWGASNNIGFSNEEYDLACNTALQALDEETRATEHAKAMKIWTEELPSIPLFARAKITVTRPNVSGVIMDPTANSEFWNVENFDFSE